MYVLTLSLTIALPVAVPRFRARDNLGRAPERPARDGLKGQRLAVAHKLEQRWQDETVIGLHIVAFDLQRTDILELGREEIDLAARQARDRLAGGRIDVERGAPLGERQVGVYADDGVVDLDIAVVDG